jgi:ABC-type uncharacterized transport system ATPase subunit
MAGPPDRRRIEPWQDPKAQPYVRIDKVTKKFGDVYAVDNVSLDIFQGEFFSLLGGSAAASPPCCACWRGWSNRPSGVSTSTGWT